MIFCIFLKNDLLFSIACYILSIAISIFVFLYIGDKMLFEDISHSFQCESNAVLFVSIAAKWAS